MKITLIYFNFPFWRAEVSRISLNSCSIDFYDKRITSEEFQNVKEKGTLHDGTIIPFHQLPCLKVDNITIAQTGAISRFCGKLANLYPKENKLKKKSQPNDKIMSYNEIKRFIMFYQRITLQMIKDLSKSASVVMFLKKNHEIKKVLFRP